MNINIIFQPQDEREPKLGWFKGDYFCTCRNCNSEFIGAKGAYNCADCAYTYSEQLEYENLWRKVGWHYTANYVCKKVFDKGYYETR